MNPQQVKEVLKGYSPELQRIVGEALQDCLYAGNDNPEQVLVDSGYERYTKRRDEYNAWHDVASDLLKD